MTEPKVKKYDVAIGPVVLPRRLRLESSRENNPGIGGSEFHSLQLAILAAENGQSVCLIVENNSFDCPQDLNIEVVFKDEISSEICSRIWISTAAAIVQPSNVSFGPNIRAEARVLVSHHPHDGYLKKALRTHGKNYFHTIVNVGRYQYFSNFSSREINIWLPTFTADRKRKSDSSVNSKDSRPFAVHSSSLHPSKGFSVVAKAWRIYKLREESRLELRVFGSQALYSGNDDVGQHESSYQPKQIAPYLTGWFSNLEESNPRIMKSIKFYGLVKNDIGKAISGASFAIQNPMGFAEADPMVVQDCFSLGVPVIGGSLFGMYDYMSNFPELTAHTPFGVAGKISKIANDSKYREKCSLKVQDYYQSLMVRRAKTEQLWIDIFKGKTPLGLDTGRVEARLALRLGIGSVLQFFILLVERTRRLVNGLSQHLAIKI